MVGSRAPRSHGEWTAVRSRSLLRGAPKSNAALYPVYACLGTARESYGCRPTEVDRRLSVERPLRLKQFKTSVSVCEGRLMRSPGFSVLCAGHTLTSCCLIWGSGL